MTTFSQVSTPLYIPTDDAEGCQFLHIPAQCLLLSVSFMITILAGVKRYLMMALICISLMANDVESDASWAYWPSIRSLFKAFTKDTRIPLNGAFLRVVHSPLLQAHASSIAITQILSEMQIPRPYPGSPESEILGGGAQQSVFSKFSKWFWCRLKSENQC